MKILVTGAAGFLGSHLTDALIAEGHDVIGLDNLYTGSMNNIKHLERNEKFRFEHLDVTEPFDFKVDQIFNLACPASPIQYQRNPVETIKTSFIGALNCLDLAKKHNATILQASTSEIYGDPETSPQNESYWGNVNPIGIRSCYDEGKRAAETIFFDYHREYDVNIKVARIFNTYGPRMDLEDGRVVSNFVRQALQNQPITLYGDGEQTRSFCYVDDLIKGLISLMNSGKKITGPINLGNPHEFRMRELAEKVLQLTNSKSSIVFEPLPSDDPKQRRPDISLAFNKLNWKPTIELDEGLKRIINDFKMRLELNE